jgi:Lectin C-type domain
MQIIRKQPFYMALAASFLLGTPKLGLATSELRQWSGNGHYYQRIDKAKVSWSTAQASCNNANGYLATLTSSNEQAFVEANFLNPDNSDTRGYHIGGLKKANTWQWLTGEKWSYTNWYQERPFNVGNHLAIYNDGYWLDKDMTGHIDGYICEWSAAKKTIGSTFVRDVNGNGTVEFATLYYDVAQKSHYVVIKDLTTAKIINTINVSKGNVAPLGVISIKNIETSNNTPEIGVLIYSGKKIYVEIKDAKQGTSIAGNNIVFWESGYIPQSISAYQDINGNGYDEIAVVASYKENGIFKTKMQIRDSKTKQVLQNIDF